MILSEKERKFITKGKHLIDGCDTVFLDVFDTLLCRDCAKPSDVFDLAELFYNQRHPPISGFKKYRIQAEKKAMEQFRAPTLDRIYDYLTLDNRNELKMMELKAEKALCHQKNSGYQLYKYARFKHRKIVAVSDMYLGADFIAELLFSNGYQIDTVIVSCEYGVGKSRGRLFKVAMDLTGAKKNKTVHIGDNPITDILGATLAGLPCLRVPETRRLDYLKNGKDLFTNQYLIPFVRNHSVFLDSRLETLGYELFGPMIVGFCQWLHKIIHSEGYQLILFCARDMKQTREIYLTLYPEDACMVRYFYVSGSSLRKVHAALTGKDKTQEAMRQLVNFRDYFSEIGGDGRKIAYVDSGINGRSQKMIVDILGDRAQIHGLYIRIGYLFPQTISDRESKSFLYGGRPNIKYNLSAPLFESLLAAPHGSTLAWGKDARGKIVPLLGDKILYTRYKNIIQQGIDKFSADWCASCFSGTDICAQGIENAFLSLFLFPKQEDVKELEQLYVRNSFLDSYWRCGYLGVRFPHIYKMLNWFYVILTSFYLEHIGPPRKTDFE